MNQPALRIVQVLKRLRLARRAPGIFSLATICRVKLGMLFSDCQAVVADLSFTVAFLAFLGAAAAYAKYYHALCTTQFMRHLSQRAAAF